MSLYKEATLSILDQTHRVMVFSQEDALCKTWHLDVSIQLPLQVDISTWLLQSAQCCWRQEDGKQKFFSGEIVSFKHTGDFSSDAQEIRICLGAYLHRLEKSGGAAFFKDHCFREIVAECIKKHCLAGQIKVVFASDLGMEKLGITQQFSEESDLAFINRYCKKQGWLWSLKIAESGADTLYFFKKSVESPLEYIPHCSTVSSPFQYGFIKSDTLYAAIEASGVYSVEILSEDALALTRQAHALEPLLGYGGGLSHFSGLPTGMQGLWYNDTEVLLAAVDGQDSLKVCGTLANRETENPVVRANKTLYQWKTPFNIALSFEDAPGKQGIAWTTGRENNRLIMGNTQGDKQGIELKASFGALHVSGNQGICLVSGKKIKEETACSRHVMIDNQWHIKNQRNKIHYEAARKAVFDFHKAMCLTSTQSHWAIKDNLLCTAKTIELNGGDLLHINLKTGGCAIQAGRMAIIGQGQGDLVLNNGANCKIVISSSGKVTVTGSSVFIQGTTTIKAHVKSYALKSLMMSVLDAGPTLALKEPGDLPQIARTQGAVERLLGHVFDLFDQKIEGKYQESGWLNSAVSLNKKKENLNGMQIEVDNNNE